MYEACKILSVTVMSAFTTQKFYLFLRAHVSKGFCTLNIKSYYQDNSSPIIQFLSLFIRQLSFFNLHTCVMARYSKLIQSRRISSLTHLNGNYRAGNVNFVASKSNFPLLCTKLAKFSFSCFYFPPNAKISQQGASQIPDFFYQLEIMLSLSTATNLYLLC